MTENRHYGTPNAILWRYYATARRLSCEAASSEDLDVVRGNTATVIIVVVATFEAFLNIWFRTFTGPGSYEEHADSIIRDLKTRKSLGYKVREWPKRVFGRGLDVESGVGREFLRLVERRNALMHFTTNCDAIEIPGVRIESLVDLTTFETLAPSDADGALRTLEGMVVEFFAVKGDRPGQCLRGLHYWLGRVAFPEEIAAAERGDA